MLRAYNYSDVKTSLANNDSPFWNLEKELMEQKIRELSFKSRINKVGNCICTACGGTGKHAFEKMGFSYYQCVDCKSLFLPVEQELLDEYVKYEELVKLRNSEEYQTQLKYRRREHWEKMLKWIKFRCFRYLGRNDNLRLTIIGDYYKGLIELIVSDDLCLKYSTAQDVRTAFNEKSLQNSDLAIVLASLQQSINPLTDLKQVEHLLSDEGVLFFSTRLGTGFDILVLQENSNHIFPLEHVFLPSEKGLKVLLERAGLSLLEIITPGDMDIPYVIQNKTYISEDNLFIRYLIEDGDERVLNDFQRFLQKANMSSYAQVMAKRG